MTLPAAAAALAQAVGDLYMWAADPSSTQALLAAFSHCFGADATHLQLRHRADGGLVEAHHTPHPDLAAPHCADHLWQLLSEASDAAPATVDSMLGSCRYALAGRFKWHGGTEALLTVLREKPADPFAEGQLQAMAQLGPHFAGAAAVGRRLAQQVVAATHAADLFNEIPAACVITDVAGRCLEANEALQLHLRGKTLRLVTGRLRFEVPDMQQRWEAALAETDATGVGRCVRIPQASGGWWRVVLRPWARPPAQRLILAVLEEHLPEVPTDAAAVSTLLKRLTQAETEVLNGLLKGQPAKAIAQRRAASVNTVRTQITAILEKTGFKSQKELMASFGASSFIDSSLGEPLPGITHMHDVFAPPLVNTPSFQQDGDSNVSTNQREGGHANRRREG